MGRMRKSRLSIYKQDRLIAHFVSSSTARTAASLCGVNRKTAAYFLLRLREIIAYELEAESEAMSRHYELLTKWLRKLERSLGK